MRVNAGKYKERLLISPQGRKTRPTSDKVRESIFNILRSNYEICGRVLDLFAGSGSLGIEALSRGASSCIFIDKSPEAVRSIIKNISFVEEKVEVYNTDWQVALRKLKGKQFDIIFLDPPYGLGINDRLLEELESGNNLSDNGVIVFEHDSELAIPYNQKYFKVDRREYSGTAVSFFTKTKLEEK